jgi:hypothetical protein
MLTRVARLLCLIALPGAATLVGCASVQTTQQYATAHGWRLLDTRGAQYFCRREQPEVSGSPGTGVRCITRPQLLALKTTDEHAASEGYRSVVFESTQYYCRDAATASPPSDKNCITRGDVRAQLAAIPALDLALGPDPSAGVVYPAHAPSEIAMGLWR